VKNNIYTYSKIRASSLWGEVGVVRLTLKGLC